MKIQFSATKTRTLVPIIIDIHDSSQKPQIIVEPLAKESLIPAFKVDVKKTKNFYQSQFWFEEEGEYRVSILAQNKKYTQDLMIGPQEFLSFSFEFGIFLISLILGFLGLILWHKKKIK